MARGEPGLLNHQNCPYLDTTTTTTINNNQRVPDVDGVVMSVDGVVSGGLCLTGGLAPHCSTVRTTVSSLAQSS